MNKTWLLYDAKNRFSEVVDCAITQGAQIITRRGKKAVVIMAFEEYKFLQQQNGSLAQFLLASPLPGSELIIEHNKSVLSTIEIMP
jgi:prevent-host-death family protein